MAKFKPLENGTWGLIGNAAEIIPGRVVTVYKSNGDRTEKTVGVVVKNESGLVIATIAGQKASRVIERPRGRWLKGKQMNPACRPQTVAGNQLTGVVAGVSYGPPHAENIHEHRAELADAAFFNEQRAELEACGIPDSQLPPHVGEIIHDGSKFDVDFTEAGVTLSADVSQLVPMANADWMNRSAGGFHMLVIRFKGGIYRFRMTKVDYNGSGEDAEIAGWRFIAATPEAAAKIASVLVVND